MQLLRCKSEQDWEGAENGLWWAFDNKLELLEPVHFNVVISTLAATKPLNGSVRWCFSTKCLSQG